MTNKIQHTDEANLHRRNIKRIITVLFANAELWNHGAMTFSNIHETVQSIDVFPHSEENVREVLRQLCKEKVLRSQFIQRRRRWMAVELKD